MSEGGYARLPGGAGEIDADHGVSPVDFLPDFFPDVTEGRVRFERDPNDPTWAINVVPDNSFRSRVVAARPEAGWTKAAENLVQAKAFASALKSFCARNAAAAAAIDDLEMARFKALGQSQSKLTLNDVRKALD